MASTKTVRSIQRLIWLYFWLLIFEGALRKWLIPQLSTPLLVIRDPVIIGAYFISIRGGMFPKDIFTKSLIYLAFLSFLGGLLVIIIYGGNNISVTLFGLRTNFLHLPLIFLTAKVFNLDDVKKLGKWFLLLAVPMAILMIYQFGSPPESFINQGAGGGGQIGSVMGKIRPPGTFSFITGAAQYFSVVTSFLIYGLVQSKIYANWLLLAAGFSLVCALAVSGSRTAVGSVGVVVLSLMLILLLRPALVGKSYKFLVLSGVVGFGISFIPSFNEGIEVLNERAENANGVEASSGGIVGRFLSQFLTPFNHIDQLPLLGRGLGMGTNAGAAILKGKAQFLLAEGEWERVLFESGFVLGLLYILLRIGLVAWMGRLCVQSVFTGNVLPLLLFGACAINILSGQFGQPTTLGFTILGGGLCLASCQLNPVIKHSEQSDEGFTNR